MSERRYNAAMSSSGLSSESHIKVFSMAIHQWAMRYNIPLRIVIPAHQIAAFAGSAYEIVDQVRQGEADQKLPTRPPLKDWLAMYRDHRRLTCVLADGFPTILGHGEEFQSTADLIRGGAAWSARNPKEFADLIRHEIGLRRFAKWIFMGIRGMRREYRRNLHDVREFLLGKDPPDPLFERALHDKPEVYFFCRVVLPCLVAYEVAPLHLLRKAQLGDLDAIEKLLRLDPAMIHEPHIAAWLHGTPGPSRQDRLDTMLRWTQEGLGNRLTRQGVKYSLGGFIVLLSEAAPYLDLQLKRIRYIPLTAGQIFKLYDAVEKDRSRGRRLIDPDFTDVSPEAFQKAIQRHKKFWPMVPRRAKGGQKSA